MGRTARPRPPRGTLTDKHRPASSADARLLPSPRALTSNGSRGQTRQSPSSPTTPRAASGLPPPTSARQSERFVSAVGRRVSRRIACTTPLGEASASTRSITPVAITLALSLRDPRGLRAVAEPVRWHGAEVFASAADHEDRAATKPGARRKTGSHLVFAMSRDAVTRLRWALGRATSHASVARSAHSVCGFITMRSPAVCRD